ncbi:hypothetical protein LEP1GSC060_3495 [Leptospira weilii serovar Ranarum str. ICFT]|uniref:Uncharacterized protein n=1 Tax=Leptospira weilii serovar Ranarum str. ICFT TaxID=1218598 RepID=N1WC81_9LEPT|nr:hypothetical protein LEP1GSC060_3495 [Leptospira weilii serovar Ranarum str. ICFT]
MELSCKFHYLGYRYIQFLELEIGLPSFWRKILIRASDQSDAERGPEGTEAVRRSRAGARYCAFYFGFDHG